MNLDKIAKMMPNSIAIKQGNNFISYSDLYKYTNCFAMLLNSSGVNRQDRVAILLDNSIEYIIAVYATLRCSCIFVPLAIDAPPDRLNTILLDCMPKIIVTDNKHFEKVQHIKDVVFVFVDNYEQKSKVGVYVYWKDYKDRNHLYIERYDPFDLAYIVYTSGSTGEPKGVAIAGSSLINFIESTLEEFNFNSSCKYISMLPFYFDGSFGGIFAPIAVGGSLIIYRKSVFMPKKLINVLISENITFFGCTPALFSLLMENLNSDNVNALSLKIISIGADFISKHSVKTFFEIFKNVRLFNRYGPTEATSIVSSYEVSRSDIYNDNQIPIGKPNKNTFFIALDSNFVKVKQGQVGELYIGGIQLMNSYWNDIETSQKAFYIDDKYGKLYKTGDMVTFDTENNYILLGRNNKMIKRNGFRVFINEIERKILESETVSKCVCDDIQGKLLAIVVPVSDNYSKSSLLDFISKKLPYYMIPNEILDIDEFIYNSNGKVDIKKSIELAHRNFN